MPEPKKGENKKTFIKRCIPYLYKEDSKSLNSKDKKNKQAYAICNSIFDKKKNIKHFKEFITEKNIDFDNDWDIEEYQDENIKTDSIKNKYERFIDFLYLNGFDFYDGEDYFKKLFFKTLMKTNLTYIEKTNILVDCLEEGWGLYDLYYKTIKELLKILK